MGSGSPPWLSGRIADVGVHFKKRGNYWESSGVILYGVQRYPAVRIESVSARKQRATPVSPVSCVPGR